MKEEASSNERTDVDTTLNERRSVALGKNDDIDVDTTLNERRSVDVTVVEDILLYPFFAEAMLKQHE